jgi:hypothetical protein
MKWNRAAPWRDGRSEKRRQRNTYLDLFCLCDLSIFHLVGGVSSLILDDTQYSPFRELDPLWFFGDTATRFGTEIMESSFVGSRILVISTTP